jgi:alkyl sulfatase BDS1-like metallo-beta-lactamase superfamily hydrolase
MSHYVYINMVMIAAVSMARFSVILICAVLAAAALAEIHAPWEPLPSEGIMDVNYNHIPVGDFPYSVEPKCMVNKAFTNWADKKATCESETAQEDCEDRSYCYWRTTVSQNMLGFSLEITNDHVIRQITPGVFDVPSQLGGIGRVQAIELSDGIILFDCMDSISEATAAKEALRVLVGAKVDNVKALVYSHSHVDHIMGCLSWVQRSQVYPTGPVHVYAHMAFAQALQAESAVGMAITKRTAEQFGNYLPPGPDGSLFPLPNYIPNPANIVTPSDWVSPLQQTVIQMDARAFVILPLVGDQDSNVALYVPDRRTVLISSIYYRNQPFIGTIRGGAPRSIDKWIASLTSVRNLNAVAIATSHGLPMVGEQQIAAELQWVIARLMAMRDYVLANINAGSHPRDIAWGLEEQNLFLRGELPAVPFEAYGYPYAAAMGVYTNSIGWYSGYPEDLEPVNRTTEAIRMATLVGSVDRITHEARMTLKNAETLDDLRWGLQMAALARRAAVALGQDETDAKWLFHAACERLGYLQVNLPKRNTYLTAAMASA